ncbi:hypothetical protein [Microbacterium sp. W4I20]|uniref:hypothetical protein n=1 Tax=Microbacterium sp. W4I20 TaxID=3042262 RepID=UPI002782EBC6|nr:hypothetical protein [Microbacterium sp. W4I20]MDQ0726828.1 hypothetical protein [Microbacterium sp. W4I20]
MTLHSDLNRNGFTFRVSEEMMLMNSWFPRKGHVEEIPLTDEDRDAHARAVLAHEECISNPWINLSGYDYEFDVLPLDPRKEFVAEETSEEHMARWIAAGRPMRNPLRDMLDAQMSALATALDVKGLPDE